MSDDDARDRAMAKLENDPFLLNRHSVTVQNHHADGTRTREGGTSGDELTEVYVPRDHCSKYRLADALEALAKHVRNTEGPFDGGRAHVIVLRSYADPEYRALGQASAAARATSRSRSARSPRARSR